ncbi:MAG: hypothetical protein J2P54_14020 [Bradyrhizobiaceae bacterium]|nr:hypothetical protein [Bradyrhizobiaceae bacterium]
MITTLLIIHGLIAVALLGALTHQTLSLWWPAGKRTGSFLSAARAVSSTSYTNAIIVLFLMTATLGALIYPSYRLGIRVVLQDYRMLMPEGSFELKEHFVTIGAGLLPAYWYFWRRPLAPEYAGTRIALTTLLAIIVWWAFLVGHVLNNIRGFGS